MDADRKSKLAQHNFWDELITLRDEQRVQRAKGIAIIKQAGLPQEANRQGLMRWYLHPAIKDTVLNTLMFFEQEIPPNSRSGRLKFQGGQVIMILEGRGYTLVDGVKHTWEEGDVLNLPLRAKGIIVQHFNTDPEKPVRFVAAEPNWVDCTYVDRGSGFEQLEDAPEYRR
jgi:hypothetical protein